MFNGSYLRACILIHLSNRSPWKKICQKYRTQQELSLFKGHPLSASMENHYVQWFLIKSVQDIMVCEKNRFCLHESGRTKAWYPGLVFGPSAKAQELVARIRGLVIQPLKLSIGAYFELSFLAVVSLFIFPTGPTALDFELCGRRYVKNMGHNRNRLYSRAIHCPASMSIGYYGL